MRRKTTYFAFVLFILCVFLYISTQYMNVHSVDLVKKYRMYIERPVIVPSIVVYAKKRLVDTRANCSKKHEPNKISILWSNGWQQLGDDSNLFLYSMYQDDRLDDKSYLRVIAMSNGIFSHQIFCKIWFQTSFSVEVVDYEELWVQNWDLAKPHQYYRPMLLSCPFNKSTIPTAASIISHPCEQPKNAFFFNKTKVATTKDFAVCVKPLDFQEDMTHRLLEWLELQFILGADEITFYKYHLPPRTLEVLRLYQKSGKVTIKDHTLPGDGNKERRNSTRDIWQKRRHEMVVYNDCFYRHIGTHKYVVNLDLDEAIIPLVDKDWKSLLEHITARNPISSESASISASNVYFFDSFGMEPDSKVPKFFHMLRHLYRSANFTPPGFAQKSFCSTNNTLSVTNHYALKALHPNIRMSSSGGRDLVQMHHYRRDCPPKMDEECEENYMKFLQKDKAILKFKDRLILNVSCKLKELNLTNLNTI